MKTTIEKFYIIGISVRTTNEGSQAAKDIPELWVRFMSEDIDSKIPNRVSHDVYGIYTEYEGDFTQPYTTVIGCKVSSLDNIPEGLVGLTIETANYEKFTAKGKLSDDIVLKKWQEIWQSNMDRAYLADFEIYGERSMDMESAEVDIFISVK
ncbi:putative transcriptional regulator YdeE [Dysgonomonas alginatilytica]|uniref:Putative transcriptional regulator YdeE n=1 Tax=Dysgonomonas alginatilytica TaxID=1605892 RepID=A0A2V3PP40_9BACT|nr:GyrI-like domain-containing protein [Dysgonomonas alginatilytica]PXV63042.1 putative transcriptional regulator YdeE [Dysgonomonas alginatilytica]